MRTAALLLLAAAGWASAGPPRELVQALSGSTKAYVGQQLTRVAGDNGFAEAKVTVYGDGKGGVRREYALPDNQKAVLLQLSGGTYRLTLSGWARVSTDQAWKPVEQAQAIAVNYRVSVETSSFLGRKVSLVTVSPLHSYNPLRKMTVDAGTGLILKDELFAPDGRLRSSSWFVSLEYKPVSSSLFQVDAAAEAPNQFGPDSFQVRASAADVEKMTGMEVPRPSYVPPGYRPVLYGTMTTGSARLMPAVRYSDGLSSFTVFERGRGRNGRRRGWGGGQGQQHEDLHSDIQRSVVFVNGPRSFVLIGDLAESELRKVARSL